MKNFITLVILLFTLSFAEGQTLQALFSYTTFNSPESGPYIETYLSIRGSSIQYTKTADGKFQGTVEVVMLFKQNDEIVNFDKYELRSPLVEDTSMITINILDQQRYGLQNGSYDFEIWLSDKLSDKKPFLYTEPITIDYPADQVNVSGIELLASYEKTEEQSPFTRGGFKLFPLVSNFYPETNKEIIFYGEIYNTSEVFGQEKFLTDYYIESFETAKKLKEYQSIKRQSAGMVVPILGKFDISDLPSGNYKLVIEARNKKNELVALNKVFFQRSNPNVQFNISDLAAINIENTFVESFSNIDTLREYIRSLAPVSSEIEKQFARKQLLSSDLQTLQQYFLNFWLTRSNSDPLTAWLDYQKELRVVDKVYRTQVLKGYETDRGRVYLKYGPPNIITESYNEPSAYPYEIWHYYTLDNNQRNKKFVFMTHDFVTNNFELIHSDVIGELSNYRWQVLLHRRDFHPDDLDVTRPPDAWGNQADKFFRDPF